MDENKTWKFVDLTQNPPSLPPFFNAVIGWSLKVCLGEEQLEQWYALRHYFFELFPLCSTHTSRLPRVSLCSSKICKK